MATQPPRMISRGKKTERFFIGFVSWFIVHVVLGGLAAWLFLTRGSTAQIAAASLSLLLFFANLVAYAVLDRIPPWRWAALGMLAATALAVCAGLICLVLIAMAFGRSVPVGMLIAMVLNLVVATVLGIASAGFFLIPFFTPLPR